jgi:biotin operon repressor
MSALKSICNVFQPKQRGEKEAVKTTIKSKTGPDPWPVPDQASKFSIVRGAHKIKKARQRLVLCRLMVDIMRTVHGTYAPVSEPFGTRLETFFIGLCVAIGDIDGKPFSVAKIAAYMRVPRTTVIRRLDQLQSWGLIDRRGRHYYMNEQMLNSLIGMRSYQEVRRFLSKATEELTVLDTLAD